MRIKAETLRLQELCLDKTDLVPLLGRFPTPSPSPERHLHFSRWLFHSLAKISFKRISKLPLSINYPCHSFEIAQTPSTAPCLLLYIS